MKYARTNLSDDWQFEGRSPRNKTNWQPLVPVNLCCYDGRVVWCVVGTGYSERLFEIDNMKILILSSGVANTHWRKCARDDRVKKSLSRLVTPVRRPNIHANMALNILDNDALVRLRVEMWI